MLSFKVEGMTCGGCARSVTRAINAVAPDAKVNVDLAGKRVQVEGVADAQVAEAAIRSAGFSVSAQ